ncbi:MAG: O-antigen ligase family protein [Chitinophagaceae bacterium]|nr:O-antigen ligase family protein [Chitinophagaceae bacterium]
MLNRLQNDARSSIIFGLALLMPASLFFSRTLLAISMLAFVMICLLHPRFKEYATKFLHTPFLWMMTLLFFVPLVSGAWSADQRLWFDMTFTKLPLLFFPFAFAFPLGLSNRQWTILAVFMVILSSAGSIWSMTHYLQDTAGIHEGYLRSNTMLTPLDNDHVRYSWLVSVAVLTAVYTGWQIRHQQKMLSLFLWLNAAWLAIFLHILAARTGLFCLYGSVFLLGIWVMLKSRRLMTGALVLLLLTGLPLAAYYTLPTFKNRVHYILYDAGFIRNDEYLRNSNDGNRVISYKAGWALLQQQPVTGYGFGDIRAATHAWYDENYPLLDEREKIYPSSEYLVYGAGAGWIGLLVCLAAMIIPFFTRVREKLPWYIIQAGIAGGFLFDIGLEVQFGVFLYTFITLGWWSWLSTNRTSEK